MEPKIVNKETFTVLGVVYEGKNENNEIPELWGRFVPLIPKIENMTDGSFGICKPANEDGSFRYMAGMGVSNVDNVPGGMQVWEVPASQYVVFPCTLRTIRDTYKHIFETWLPGSGYTYVESPDFEYYDENFNADVEGSILYIYVPVKK